MLLLCVLPRAHAQSKATTAPVPHTLLNSQTAPDSVPNVASSAALGRTAPNYGALPLRFERNLGQASPEVGFLAVGAGYVAAFQNGEVGFVLRDEPSPKDTNHEPKKTQSARPQSEPGTAQPTLWMSFAGARANAAPAGDDAIETKSNYYLGADPSRWLTGVPNYARVRYANLYRGVDLDFHGDENRLEYDFTVSPHADPSSIAMNFRGAAKITVRDGAAILRTRGGEMKFERPRIFQERDGKRQEIPGEFVLRGKNRLGFRVGAYDRSQTLVIDPVLSYATYIAGDGGGGHSITVTGLAVDVAGEAVVGGDTQVPTQFGVTPPMLSPISQYVFITKFNAAGNGLIFSTLIAGDGTNFIAGLALDPQGAIYFTGGQGGPPGSTPNYPTTPGAYRTSAPGCGNCSGTGFLTKLSPTGAMVYSTYLSSFYAEGNAIAVDASGDAYVAGVTSGGDMQVVGGFQPQGFAFVQEFDPRGQSLLYSTFFDGSAGGPGGDATTHPTAVAVDGDGGVYVTGTTNSPDFPTQNAIQPVVPGISVTSSAFLTKFTPAAGAIDYSTHIGLGTTAIGMAVDSSHAVYLTGITPDLNFPVTQNSFISPPCIPCGWSTAFVVKVDPSGGSLLYSTLLGPISTNLGNDLGTIAVDNAGNAYLTGGAMPTFPTVNAIEPEWPGSNSYAGFVTKLDSTGTPTFSTYLGSESSAVVGRIVAVDSVGNVYAAGTATLGDFPLLNAYQNPISPCCQNAAFVAKINMALAGPVASLSPLQFPATATLRNMGTQPLKINQITPEPIFGSTCIAPLTLNAGEWCLLNTGSSTVTVTTNSPSNPQVFSLISKAGTSSRLLVTPGNAQFGSQLVGTVSAPQALTLTSTSGANIYQIFSRPPFLETNNCPAFLTPGSSCTVEVEFAPPANLADLGNSGVFVTTSLQDTPEPLPVSGWPATNAIAVAPTNIQFHTQYIGATPLPHAVVVTNVTDGPLTMQSISLSNPAFSETDNCAGPLAPQASCRILVSFQPNAAVEFDGTLQIIHGSVGFSQTLQVSGMGATANALTVSPNPLGVFGIVGVKQLAQNVVVKNVSPTPVDLTGFSIQPADFSIAQTTCPPTLAPAASCNVQVAFTAPAPESIEGSLTIHHSGVGSPAVLNIAGSTFPTSLTAFPSPLIFADQELSTTSAAATLSLGAQSGPDTVTAISIDNPDFRINTSASCVYPLPHTLTTFIGGCGISISFTPSALGQRTASLTITTTVEPAPRVVPLVGNGVSTALEVSPAALQFPPQFVGLLGAMQPITLTNVSGGALAIPSITVTGPFSQSNNCGGSIALGMSCTIKVSFSPTIVGSNAGVLNIQDSAEASPHTVALTGSGAGAALSISSTNLIFLDQPVGTKSVAYPVTLTNNTASALAISTIATAGDFAQINNCGAALPSMGSCTINVTFTPTTTGLRNGTLSFSYGAPAVQQAILLSGNGGDTPTITIAPTSLTFATLLTGAANAQLVQIGNSSKSAALIINNIVVSGQGFSISANNCGLGIPAASLNPCSVFLQFAPPSLGSFPGTMQIFDTAAGSPHTIPLNGQGTNFTLTALNTPPIVTHSLPLTLAVGVGAVSTASDTVALGCSVSPTLYQCKLSQNSLVLNQTKSFTATVSLAGSSSIQPAIGLEPGDSARRFEMLLAGVVILAWLAFLSRGHGTASSMRFAAMMMALALLLSLGLASCGGGGSSGGSSASGGGTQTGGGTTPAPNILTITGTSSNSANPPQTVQVQFVPQ